MGAYKSLNISIGATKFVPDHLKTKRNVQACS